MKVVSLNSLIVLAMLLAGCRSEKEAFQFRPAASVAATVPAAASKAAPTDLSAPVAPPAPALLPPAPTATAKPAASRAVAVVPAKRPLGLLRRARQEAQSMRAWQQARTPRRATDGETDVLHVVLGTLLILGGIILGLALGGWLGLGVGAAVVLLGYYFLVLGIGGSHAWLEIFQEFFNM